jgi:hypothetical protein
VRHDQQRLPAAAPLQARDQVGAVRLELERLGRDAFLLELFLHVGRHAGFVARRVGGIDAEHGLVVAHHLVFKGRGLGTDRSRGQRQ